MKKFKLIDGAFFLALFLLFLLPPTDPDLGWHLRCGQEIWREHSLCNQNQFSVLLENYTWPNHYWLYQVIIFPFNQLAGLWGLTLFNALLMSSTFFLFYWVVKNYLWEKMLAIGFIVFLSWGIFSFGIRSQLMGFFFFSLLLSLLAKVEQNPKLMAFLPLIMLAWANSHGSVIIGLIILAFFWLKEAIGQNKRLPLLTLILLLSSAITLINPYGWKIYQDAWRHFAVVSLGKLIAEWVPPSKIPWWTVLVSSFGFFFYLLVSEKKEKVLAFLVLPFALAALRARRNVPLYFFLGFYLFFASTLTKKILAPWLKKKRLRNNLARLTTLLFLFFGLFIRLPQTLDTNLSWENYCQKSFLSLPCEAVEFLKAQPDKGNIFNRYEWGGFLIWQLPEYKIFVDGRMPAWSTPSGKSPYAIYLETLQTQPGWEEILREYHLYWILISPGTFMDLKLRPDPEEFGWEAVYRDQKAVIFKQK